MGKHIRTGRLPARFWKKTKAKPLLALLPAVCALAGALIFTAVPGTLASPVQTVLGTYYLVGGCDNGFNLYHMEGNDPVGSPVYYPTFCTHRNYTSAPGSYTYFRNTDPNENLGPGGGTVNETLKNMLDNAFLNVAQYRSLRYMIAYTNINKFVNGQYIYWAWLAHTYPAQYSGIGSTATANGFPWNNAYNTYFGSVAGTLGGGAVAAGQGLGIGDQCYTGIRYNGTDITAAAVSGTPPLHPAVVTTGTYRVGPYVIDWDTAGLSRVLAQLNYGPNRDTAPLFDLSAVNAADSGRVRFYIAGSATPTTAVALGQQFYVDYVVTGPNLKAAEAGIEIPVKAVSQKDLAAKILADRFFAHPNAQNQINIEMETRKPVYCFNVRYRSPPTTVVEAEWVRPTVDKTVAEYNNIDAAGIYQDVLRTPAGGNVIHKMTVAAAEPKSTELIFRAADYDLPPENNSLPVSNPNYVALVATAAQLHDALTNNYNIKLVNNVALPSSWAAPATVYTKIFDGNGCALTAGNMSDCVLRTFGGGVIYRLKFTGFDMVRAVSAAAGDTYTGALADRMQGGRLVNVYLDGALTVNDGAASTSADIRAAGGVAGYLENMAQFYGVQAKMKITHNFAGGGAYTGVASRLITGGVAGVLLTPLDGSIEACELLPGSEISSAAYHIGGFIGYNNTTVTGGVGTPALTIADCKADVAVTPQRGGSTFGGLVAYYVSPSSLRLLRSVAQGSVGNSAATRLNQFGGLLGDCTVNVTVDNCLADFGGLTVYCVSGGGLAANRYTRTSGGSVGAKTIQNSEAKVNLSALSHAAGIYCTARSVNDVIRNCKASGVITIESGDQGGAGILLVQGTADSAVTDMAVVENCVAHVYLEYKGAGKAVLAGIACTVACSADVADNFFTGGLVSTNTDVATAAFADPDTMAAAITVSNNYTTVQAQRPPGAPYYQAAYFSLGSSSAAASLFGSGGYLTGFSVGAGDTTAWKYAPEAPWVPALNNLGPSPVQRIYVHDYYNGETTPVSLGDLYVYEGGVFKNIWNSNYAMAGSNSAGTTILMDYPAHQTFTFYYRVSNLTEGVYHNDVKLMPMKSSAVGGASPYDFDWGGAKDDDWVIAYQNRYFLNLRKLTNVSNYPITLNGTSFRLWYTPMIYGDLTGVAYTGWTSETLNNVDGDFGKTFLTQLKPGSYVLREISAPEYYNTGENLDRVWYGVFQNGRFTLYENDPTFSFPAKKMSLGESYSADGYTLTYTAQIMNTPDPTKPYARIVIDKRNEDGSQPIMGQEVTDPATYMPRWTGAVYQVEKFDTAVSTDTFDPAGFFGVTHGYGNMIRCNESPLNYCDIEYGYYCVTERQAPEGYMVDPTPFYVAFTKDGAGGAGTLRVFDQHTPGADQVGYMAGVQDLYVQAQITVVPANTTNPIGQTITAWVATIPARDKKPEYKFALHKYSVGSGVALPGIEFKLYRDSDGALIGTYTTGAAGELSFEFPPMVDGFYTLKETGGDIADYRFETRAGALLINGGPHNYGNVKIIRGGLDTHCYVIVDADGYAWVVNPGDPRYPPDLEPVTETQLGVVHVLLSVPNIRYVVTEYFHPDTAPFPDLLPPAVTVAKPGASFTGAPPAAIPDGANPPWVYVGYREGDSDSAPLIPGSPPAPLVPSVNADYDFIYVYTKINNVSFTIRKTLGRAAAQTERFVYMIEYLGKGGSAGPAERTFYSVLHVLNGQVTDSVATADVPEGWYRVTELDSNWRYTLDQAGLAGDNAGAAVSARAVTRQITSGSPVFAFRNDRDDVPWVHSETGVVNDMPPISSYPR